MSRSRSKSAKRQLSFVDRSGRGGQPPMAAIVSKASSTSSVDVPGMPPALTGASRSPWLWMAVAVVFLAVSGGARAWQDARFSAASRGASAAPFPLKSLPASVGPWHALAGTEQTLDPRVARIAGCSDHVIRTYVHEATGVQVTAMVLYGNAEAVSGHTPEVCYPSAGYGLLEGPIRRDVPLGESKASFRSSLFARGKEDSGDREEVYYAFRHEGQWFADAENHWKVFRHRPSMYKVQTQRQVVHGERRDLDNPSEAFLRALLPAIEGRLNPVTARTGIAPLSGATADLKRPA
ncbi:MAG: exosortase-associated EpsI family protein [Isosphaeraceae bacterium]|nr:exosortase-associated EpsI family protein [Isosphaeraceae bacterium]